MYTFHVQFITNGQSEPRTISYRERHIAGAFEHVLRRFRGARLIRGWVKESFRGPGGTLYTGITYYDPPSTVRVEAQPTPNEEQLVFNFPEVSRPITTIPIRKPIFRSPRNLTAQAVTK